VALKPAREAGPEASAARTLAVFGAIVLLALFTRLAAGPGTDVPPFLRDYLGRAPRLDAFWYTRPAVEAVRGAAPTQIPAKFNRPLYTALCRAVYAVAGTSPRALALPSIAAGALGAGLVFLLAARGGFRPGAAALAGVFAATCWQVWAHDREPLVYSTVNAAALAALLVWAEGLRAPPFFLAGWALLFAAAGAGKETVLLAAPGLAIAQWSAARSARARWLTLVALAAGGIAVVLLARWLAPAFFYDVAAKLESRTAIADLRVPGGFAAALAGIGESTGLATFMPGIGALVAVGAAATLLEGRPEPADRALAFRRMLVPWLFAGSLLVVFFAYRPTRYVLVLFPAACLLAAHGAAVLAGRAAAPVRRGPLASAAIVFGASWLVAWGVLTFFDGPLGRLGPGLFVPAKLGIAGVIAAGTAAGRGPALAAAGRWKPVPWLGALLVLFALATDGVMLYRVVRAETHVDLAARRSFEAMVGRGARVEGYGAHYLAFDPDYTPIIFFEARPTSLLTNRPRATHLATFWFPELSYIERIMEAEGRPLAVVGDVSLCNGRFRIYRLPDAEEHGYAPTPFERARALEAAGRIEEAAGIYRDIARAPAADPVVLGYAGAAIGEVAPEEGERLLRRACAGAPWDPFALRALADLRLKSAARAPGAGAARPD
jgi:hypothetical protein